MIYKNIQNEIIKKITNALKSYDLGIIIMRPKDNSLVLYINDRQSAIRDAHRFNDTNFQGGN